MKATAALRALAAAGLFLVLPLAGTAAEGDDPSAAVARGRYLVQVGACNDCHTAGYAETGGEIPERDWLTGDRLGWQGPWGTTYPVNLRLYMAALSEDEWVARGRTLRARPPMPWFNVQRMTDEDLRALYRYVRVLGPAGGPAPAFVPPQQPVAGPVVRFPDSPG